MKKTKQIQIAQCDFCDSTDSCYSYCYKCGKDICYSCEREGNQGVTLRKEPWIIAGNDPFICVNYTKEAKKEPRIQRLFDLKKSWEEYLKHDKDAKAAIDAKIKIIKNDWQ